MALEATHLRFALDVRDDYRVADFSRYLSGAIYPDSRYVSGVDRTLTHPKAFSDIPLPTSDDFRKGWETHLIYDLLQGEVFSGMSESMRGSVGQGDDVWRERTACKIIQNEIDFGFLDAMEVSSKLNVVLTPFNEPIGPIRRYFDCVVDFLREGTGGVTRIEDIPIFKASGLSEKHCELLDDVCGRCECFRNDPIMMEKISGIYDETMRMYREQHR